MRVDGDLRIWIPGVDEEAHIYIKVRVGCRLCCTDVNLVDSCKVDGDAAGVDWRVGIDCANCRRREVLLRI